MASLDFKLCSYCADVTGEAQQLERRLMKELSTTFRELQAMVQICVQHGKGEDPNISSLLGIKCEWTTPSSVTVMADLALFLPCTRRIILLSLRYALAWSTRNITALHVCTKCCDISQCDVRVSSASTAASEFDQDEPVGDNLASLKYKISRVKQLQADVDRLRELLSDKYAEEWGDNLNCITQ